jgi:hypothetical protein
MPKSTGTKRSSAFAWPGML